MALKYRNLLIPLHHSKGLTLVEVMIAMVIGLIILGALSGVMINNLRTSGEIEKVGQQIENGRFALQTIIDDLSNAGFYAGAQQGNATENDFCQISELDEEILSPSLQISDSVPSCVSDMKPNTQYIAIRRFSTSSFPTSTAVNCPSGQVCVQLQSDGTPSYSTGKMEIKTHSGNLYAAVYTPVMSLYYIDQADRLRHVHLNWSSEGLSTANEVIAEGIEMLSFQRDGQQVVVNLLARSIEPTQSMKVEKKTYPAFIVNDKSYTTEDKVRRHFYSVAVNLYNSI